MKPHPIASLRRALRLLPLLAAPACSTFGLDPAGDKRDDLRQSIARWEQTEIRSYRYTYAEGCAPCDGLSRLVVEVHQGAVTTARPVGEAEPLPVTDLAGVPTVPDLFAVIERAIDERADALDVAYHPTLGYPTRIAIDREFGREGDELAYFAEDLRRVAPPPGGG